MGRDATLLEGGNFFRGAIDEPLKLKGRTCAAKPLAESIGQQGSFWRVSIVLEPPP
jgi:hypothetical protein